MVALFPALSVGLTSLTAAFLLYPRLPHYSFQIRSVRPLWYKELGFRAKLGAKVQLRNDNYMAIDIHALSFDLFYPDWFGKIQVLGNVQDASESIFYQESGMLPLPPSDKNESSSSSSWMDEWHFLSSNPPLWHMEARKHFETHDSVLMEPMGGLSVMANLGWDMVRNYGVVQVQSTGAIHIKANSQMPLTLNILCDNVLDAWTLEMQGMHCALDHLEIGWKDIPTAMKKLRLKLLRQPEETVTKAVAT